MGSKSAGSQTVTQQPDQLTQDWRKMVMQYGMGALGLGGTGDQSVNFMGQHMTLPGTGLTPMGGQLAPVPGLSPYTKEAIGAYQSALPGLNLGFGALSGNADAVSQLMNPYQSNVIDQVKGQYGDLANLTTNALNDQATQAHAFGGSRQGVAQGVALGQLDKGLGQQIAGLQYQGFNDAMNRAGSLANMGLGAAGNLAQLGDYARQVQMSQDPVMRRLQIMQGLLTGLPFGQSQTTPLTRNPLAGALGGASAGSAFGPVGAGIGGLLGLFG